MTDYLRLDDLLEIAEGVVPGAVVRDLGMMASAAERPRQTVFGRDAYPTFEHKAAALLHSLARNHALVDGNKRLAWAATSVFCQLNDRILHYGTVDEAEALVVSVSVGDRGVEEIADWLRSRLRDTPAARRSHQSALRRSRPPRHLARDSRRAGPTRDV